MAQKRILNRIVIPIALWLLIIGALFYSRTLPDSSKVPEVKLDEKEKNMLMQLRKNREVQYGKFWDLDKSDGFEIYGVSIKNPSGRWSTLCCWYRSEHERARHALCNGED